ncbi:hypothetical protein QW131_08960 [Roseibium salinum]|nr:hypothetical protein [Roseibium salinum]
MGLVIETCTKAADDDGSCNLDEGIGDQNAHNAKHQDQQSIRSSVGHNPVIDLQNRQRHRQAEQICEDGGYDNVTRQTRGGNPRPGRRVTDPQPGEKE